MKGTNRILTAVALLFFGVCAFAQNSGRRSSPSPCQIGGAYRINVAESDRLYTAVRGATSSVPFGDQSRFFMDLSVRLTPPDLLAIECSGSRVSVGSSRAPKVTFLADGRTRKENSPTGGVVYSRISMTPEMLTFTSTGKAEDNLNVVFRAVDGGRKLQVTRRIYAEQLSQPIVIRSVYERLTDSVDWDVYGQGQVARQVDDEDNVRPAGRGSRPTVAGRTVTGRQSAADLRHALDEWIAATNGRDIERQMSFYMPTLQAFYLTRNTPRSAVRAEKNRAFLTARTIDIRAEEPEIVFQDGGRIAVMRFRKQYRIVDRTRTRSGEVVQELRWQSTPDGWRIFSERDVRVIR